MLRSHVTVLLTGTSLLLASCGGGGGGSGGGTTTPPTPVAQFTPPAQEALNTSDVERILAQGIEEARARNKPAVLAVTDRVGNVLAVYAMAGAPTDLTIKTPPNGRTVQQTDLDDRTFPGAIAAGAIAKAVTGAYLSSSGNSFSTRTASDIVQETFPAGASTAGLESGPLFGVQFSQLPCSDFSSRFTGDSSAAAFIGPKRSPLGLSADPGGIPLYKNGVVVGGLGVMSDPLYSYDARYDQFDRDEDEVIALAASTGFERPAALSNGRFSTNISIDGFIISYLNAERADLSFTGTARSLAALNAAGAGALIPVRGYSTGAIVPGTAYGSEASGIRKATAAEFNDPDVFVFSNGSGAQRNGVRAGTDTGDVAQPLTETEVRTALQEAFNIMRRGRAAIRKPDDSRIQVTISVVDTRGQVLGMIRSPDAPVFGADVSLQKARTAAFFSNARAASDLSGEPGPTTGLPNVSDVRAFVPAAQAFNGQLTLNGNIAISGRLFGLLDRPYFPDGQLGTQNGPFSQPIGRFSPFSTGLQTALIFTNLAQHVTFVLGGATDTRQRCTFLPDAAPGQNRLQNGIQIFPGSTPIYRGNTLVGAIGISGDGIDQDDMIAFLGAFNAGQKVGGISLAPTAIRGDTVRFTQANNARLNYVQCPFAPFLDTATQNVCEGK